MIHSTAIIGKDVKIGRNVKIGPYCVIGDGAVIGDDVEIKSHVVTEGRVTLGLGVKIHPFASLSYPQTLKYKGEDSEVIIGKNTVIREYVTVQHGTAEDKMKTVVGDNCLLMVGVHIAHNCVIGNNVIFANYASLAGHVEVGDNAIIGGLSAVQQFARIGNNAMIGGASAVDKDVIPYGLVANERATLSGINLVGMNRAGIDKKMSLEASKVVKDIFLGEGSFNERAQQAKEKYSNNSVITVIIDFILSDNSRNFCGYK